MPSYKELLNMPLPSRKEELTNYAYESAEKEMGSSEDVSIVGFYIDETFPDYIMEDTLGEINFGSKLKTAIVEIRTKEGWTKPHVHILNEKFNIAVRLDVPEYFIHPHAEDIFSSNKQAKKFDEFMRSKTYEGQTYWEWARTIFNNRFGPEGHPLKCDKQPDYTKLP